MAGTANEAPVVVAVAITGSVPRKKDNPRRARGRSRSRSNRPSKPSRRGPRSPTSTSHDDEAPPPTRPVRRRARGPAQALSRHDRPVLDGWARAGSAGARPVAEAPAGYGLPLHGVGELPDHRPTESREPRDRPRLADERVPRPSRDRDFRPLPHPRREASDGGGADRRAAARPVRHGVQYAMPADEHLLDISSPSAAASCRRPRGRRRIAAIRQSSWTGPWRAGPTPSARGCEDNIPRHQGPPRGEQRRTRRLAVDAVTRHGRRGRYRNRGARGSGPHTLSIVFSGAGRMLREPPRGCSSMVEQQPSS